MRRSRPPARRRRRTAAATPQRPAACFGPRSWRAGARRAPWRRPCAWRRRRGGGSRRWPRARGARPSIGTGARQPPTSGAGDGATSAGTALRAVGSAARVAGRSSTAGGRFPADCGASRRDAEPIGQRRRRATSPPPPSHDGARDALAARALVRRRAMAAGPRRRHPAIGHLSASPRSRPRPSTPGRCG